MTDDILADRWQTHLARCHDLLASEWAKAIAAAQEYLSGDDLKRDEADNLRDAQRPQSIDEWCEDPSRFSSDLTGFRDPA